MVSLFNFSPWEGNNVEKNRIDLYDVINYSYETRDWATGMVMAVDIKLDQGGDKTCYGLIERGVALTYQRKELICLKSISESMIFYLNLAKRLT